jgi:hypothetical protein
MQKFESAWSNSSVFLRSGAFEVADFWIMAVLYCDFRFWFRLRFCRGIVSGSNHPTTKAKPSESRERFRESAGIPVVRVRAKRFLGNVCTRGDRKT